VAVDPNVIPLGTRLYIPGYGEALAADTGSAVIGNIIDLGFADYEVPDWHTRWVTVYILE
jgi:3D (Asp-Asp-Asp) domain-containing protein